MQNHWKKHNHKIDMIFILGNPQGEENPSKLPLYKMYKIKPQNRYSPPYWSISLSSMCSSSEWVYVIMRNTAPLFIHIMSINFYPKQVGPTKLSRPTSPKQTQNSIFNFILFMGVLLTRLTMEALPHESMMTNYNIPSRRRKNNISLGLH